MDIWIVGDADSHKHLSSSGVRGIIAGGIIGIICVAALAMILKDLHGARALKVDLLVTLCTFIGSSLPAFACKYCPQPTISV